MKRRGTILVVVLFLAMIAFGALFAVSYSTRTDVASSSRMLRELKATCIAESISAQIEARVGSRPWDERFWFVEAQARGSAGGTGIVPLLALDRRSRYLNLTGDTLPASDYDFSAVVKDLPEEALMYRVYVEVTLGPDRFAFAYDKTYDRSLLGTLNRDATVADKPVEDAPGGSGADGYLGAVRGDAGKKRPPDRPPRNVFEDLRRQYDETRKNTGIGGTPDPDSF